MTIVTDMAWMLVVIAVSIVVALFRGGKLSNLPDIHADGWPLLFVGFGMQIAANFLPDDQQPLAVGLLLGSYAALVLMVWMNRREAGMWIAGIGILMNLLVIGLNGGMPVLDAAVEIAGGSPDLALSAKHVWLNGTTRLPFLADIIPLPGAVISLGDVFLAIGLGVFVEDQLQQPVRLFRHRVKGIPGSAAER
jgi:hypothetical protein